VPSERGADLSFAELLQLQMPHDDVHSVPAAQALCYLLRKIHGAMLAAGASERHHQVLETALLVISHARIHERHDVRKKLMHTLLLIEVIDDRRILARQRFEPLFAPGIREAAAIENESATVPGIILRQIPVKGKT